eukprot:scaffold3110_cov341-Prasinococcus_capsulatus_cf.AAC.1
MKVRSVDESILGFCPWSMGSLTLSLHMSSCRRDLFVILSLTPVDACRRCVPRGPRPEEGPFATGWMAGGRGPHITSHHITSPHNATQRNTA